MIILASETYISLLGIKILEPVTMLTDLIVSAVCFTAFFRLRNNHNKTLHSIYFRWFFFTMGLATALGGIIGHGFLYIFSFGWKLPGWLISMISISLMERAGIEIAKPLIKKRFRIILDYANIAELLIFMILTFSTLNFRFVEIHSAFGLLLISTPVHLFIYSRTRHKGSLKMLSGIGFAMISALLFINEISLSIWFNHMDISHVFMAAGAFLFYRSATDYSFNFNPETQKVYV